MTLTQQNREAGITTPLEDDVLLLHVMTMTEKLGRVFTMDLELLSATENINFEDLLGQKVTIRLDISEDEQRFFNGHVSRFSQSGNQGSFAVYKATVHPWLWFLTRTSDCCIFQQKTVPDIIKEVFRRHGFTDFEERLSGSYRTWEYCVQYRETDFNFVSRLMEQEGIYYYFKHEEEKHTLILSDAYSSHEPVPGYESIPYYPPDDSSVRDEESISNWYISKQVQPGIYALNEYDFKRPKANLEVNSNIAREHSASDFEVYDYPGEYVESTEGDSYVRTRIEELHAQYEQAQGQGDARGIMCGGLFELSEHPREDQDREYLVVAATHTIYSDAFESGSGGGGSTYSNSFSVIDSQTSFRPERITPKPMVQGPQTAMVVGPAGEEIYTDEHGRVKLQYHWDRYGLSDENSSCWIRVSQVHAGKGFGGIDTPRIGEEVIVEFLEGDPDRPIITGRVYNGDNAPPGDLPGASMVSGMKSNSTPGGGGNNAIMLDDTKGNEGLNTNAQYNMDTTVGNDQTNTINNNRTTSVSVDDTESVGSNQKIDIGSNQEIAVGADQKISVGSNKDVTVGANHTENVGANQNITIGSSKTENVSVLYSLTVGAAMNQAVGAALIQEVGAAKVVEIGAAYMLDVGAVMKESVGASKNSDIGATLSEKIGGAHNEKVSGAYALKASQVKIEAPKIVLVAGGSKITLDGGGITIKGAKISLKASGSLSAKAGGTVKIKGATIKQN